MPLFNTDAARALAIDTSGDGDRRAQAVERASKLPFPSAEEEIWRYSRIAELDLDQFQPVSTATTVEGGEGLLSDADEADLLGDDHPDLFDELNLGFRSQTLLRVPAGKAISGTVVVTHTVSGAGTATFPRLLIDAGPDSELTVIERFVSAPGERERSLVVPAVQIRAQQAARVRYVAINDLGPAVWQIGSQRAIGERDSTVLLGTVALGGDYARVRTDARLTGQGASARQVALYFAGGSQMHDFRTTQDHAAPKTMSDLLFKGAVQDTAKSVYTGLIRIREDAKGSNAFQTNRNLTLSEGAWAESVPNLDIATNDVRCSHASTVGPVDVDQQFYLESRGIRPEVAERLVVMGFFAEVLEQLPVGPFAAGLTASVASKLAHRSAPRPASDGGPKQVTA